MILPKKIVSLELYKLVKPLNKQLLPLASHNPQHPISGTSFKKLGLLIVALDLAGQSGSQTVQNELWFMQQRSSIEKLLKISTTLSHQPSQPHLFGRFLLKMDFIEGRQGRLYFSQRHRI